ncbi:hypothetical protein LA080_004410 [Diaporthe eres]|nr:hypothetical protein LA080_004410 [Diaporthe eres]
MTFAWFPETSGIFASTSLLIALVVILAAYDGKAVFEWKGVTLNAVLSVISTASKASLLYSISELISQWKWIVFTSTRRPLIDFETNDAASRGPWGSLELMWKCKSLGYLRLGTLVVLLSIAADPLTQQLIQYKQSMVYAKDVNTTVNRAGRFAKGKEVHSGECSGFILSEVNRQLPQMPEDVKLTLQDKDLPLQDSFMVDADLSIQSAILYGLEQPMQNVAQQATFSCPTGNCSWPSFESLAVCNRCTDLRSSLNRITTHGSGPWVSRNSVNGNIVINNNSTVFRLPNGHYLENVNSWKYGMNSAHFDMQHGMMMTTLGTANTSETISTKDIDTLIWSMSMIRVEPDLTNSSEVWPNLLLSAMECALFYCANNYETTVSNGALRETSRQVADFTREETSWQPNVYDPGSLRPLMNSIAFQDNISIVRTDLLLLSPVTGNRFNISQAAVDSISHYYQSTFASELYFSRYSDSKFNGYYKNSSQIQFKPVTIQALFSSKDLDATFTALAVSMSNAIRTGADEVFDGLSISVTGLKGDTITCYRIVWPWISLYCFIVITLEEMWQKARASRVTFFDKDDASSFSLEHLDFDPLEAAFEPPNTADATE